MLTEVKGRGGNRLALQWPPRAGFGRRTREDREGGREARAVSEEQGVGGEREERRGERGWGRREGSLAVVTKILYC